NSSSISLRSDRDARQSPTPRGRGSKSNAKGSRKYSRAVSKELDGDAEDLLTDGNSVPPDDSVLSEASEGSEDEIADNLLGGESD
ncbi:13336_t:CDS:1, partial [Acaulospora colombiana]